MSNKRITQALKDLFLGLGGDASMLSDNQTVSDYIDDLESAIKAEAEGVLPAVTAADNYKQMLVIGGKWKKGSIINDAQNSEVTTYSSQKMLSTFEGRALGVWFSYNSDIDEYTLVEGSSYPTTDDIYRQVLAHGRLFGRVEGSFPAGVEYIFSGANITGNNSGTVSFSRSYVDNGDIVLEVLTLNLINKSVENVKTILTSQE